MSTFVQTELKDFADRLKYALGDESAHSLAKRTGISNSVIRKYIDDGSKPSIDKAILMADALNVDLLWLITGKSTQKGSETGGFHGKSQDGYEGGAPLPRTSFFTASIVEKAAAAMLAYIENNNLKMEPESFGQAVSLICMMGGDDKIDASLVDKLVKFKGY